MPTKPFNTVYRIPVPTGYVVINGEQVTKIVASRASVPLVEPDQWKVTFHLSDGSIFDISPSAWTVTFVTQIFERSDS